MSIGDPSCARAPVSTRTSFRTPPRPKVRAQDPRPYPSPHLGLEAIPSSLPQDPPPVLARTRESCPRPTPGPRPPGQAHLACGVGGSAARPPPPRQASPGPPALGERPLQRPAPKTAPGATTCAGEGVGGESSSPTRSSQQASPPTPPAARAQSRPGRRRGLRPAPSNREFSHW